MAAVEVGALGGVPDDTYRKPDCPAMFITIMRLPLLLSCRAKKAAAEVGAPGDPLGVPEGTYVDVHVAAVPSAVASSVIARVAAAAKVCVAESGTLVFQNIGYVELG